MQHPPRSLQTRIAATRGGRLALGLALALGAGSAVWLGSGAMTSARAAQEQALGAQSDPLAAALAESGIHFDRSAGWLAFDSQVGVVDQALEYLLVTAGGARHESLLTCEVEPSVVNAALLALGLEPGTNAVWSPVGEELVVLPGEKEAELDLEAEPWRTRTVYEVTPPSGDGLFLHVAWRRGEELFFQRVEDLLVDAERDRPMRRHRMVYLGSKWIDVDGEQVFAADRERNLISVALFSNGHVLLTPALPECERQDGWFANPWLLPERGAPLLLIASRERLTAIPEGCRERLPDLGPEEGPETVRSSSAAPGEAGPQ